MKEVSPDDSEILESLNNKKWSSFNFKTDLQYDVYKRDQTVEKGCRVMNYPCYTIELAVIKF